MVFFFDAQLFHPPNGNRQAICYSIIVRKITPTKEENYYESDSGNNYVS